MLLTPENHTELLVRLKRLIDDAKASNLAPTVAALEFAAFLLTQDLDNRPKA